MDESTNQSIISTSSTLSSDGDKRLEKRRSRKKLLVIRRRSERRRKNVQETMRSSALPTRILHEKSFDECSIMDKGDSNSEQMSLQENSNNFVFQTASNFQPKTSFWTVTDRQAEWYKLSAPKQMCKSSEKLASEKFEILDEERKKTKSARNFVEIIENPNNATELTMKTLMKELDYDLDDEDFRFIEEFNRSRKEKFLTEENFENAIIIFEFSAAENIRAFLKQKICDDDDIVCDICLLPDGDRENEMVFCERCHICVHQNCYGITFLTDEKWLCRSCSILRRPSCILCPIPFGPMKPTTSGTIWCHLTCALWLPEVKFGDYTKMEPILNLHKIPHARWSLRCVVCSTTEGACVQCAQKNCRTPFHVTCGLAAGYFLDVQQTSRKESNGVRSSEFNAYCSKHSNEARQRSELYSHLKDDEESSHSSSSSSSSILMKDPLTIYRREQLKREKWMPECNRNFFTFVSSNQLNKESSKNYDRSTSEKIFQYWKSKRQRNSSLPLIHRIEFVLEQRENADLLLTQINGCLNIRQKIYKIENDCKSLIDRPSMNPVGFDQRFQNLKDSFLSSNVNRTRRRTLPERSGSTGEKSSKRQRKSVSCANEHHQIVEQAKSCQVLLESTYRHDLQLNTTYFLVETIEGQTILLSKSLLEESNLISLMDSNEKRRENNEKIDYQSEESEVDDDRKKFRQPINIFHSMQTPYRSQGNVVTCVTGSFN